MNEFSYWEWGKFENTGAGSWEFSFSPHTFLCLWFLHNLQTRFFFVTLIHPSSISFHASSQFLHPDGDTILIRADFANDSEIGHNGRLEVRQDGLVVNRLLLWILGPWRVCEHWKAEGLLLWLPWSNCLLSHFSKHLTSVSSDASSKKLCSHKWWLPDLSWSLPPRLTMCLHWWCVHCPKHLDRNITVAICTLYLCTCWLHWDLLIHLFLPSSRFSCS